GTSQESASAPGWPDVGEAGDQRPLVQERGHLLPVRGHVHGRQRRRDRRLRRPDAPSRLPPRAGRHGDLADALPDVARAGRRLRRLRLLRREPGARDAGRLRRVHAGRQAARNPGDHRPGRQPHLRSAPVVPGRAAESRLALPRLVRLVGEAAGERGPGHVFPGGQKSTWSYDKEARAWDFHRFYDFQPDLNPSNPNVQAEILKIMGFWIQLGVSGFRMDAVPFVISTKGPRVRKPVEQYELLRSLRAFLQWRVGDSIILAEANVLPETDMEYFGRDGDRMHMMFNFQVNQHLFYALASSDSRPLARSLKATMRRPETAQWGLFLRNHDELDLGRLTQEQRRCVFDRFGPDKHMQLYERGIRRRLAPMLN